MSRYGYHEDEFDFISKPEYGLTIPTILEDDRKLIFFEALKLVEQINKFYDLCGSIELDSDGMLPNLQEAVGELEDFAENKLCIETRDERYSRIYYEKHITDREWEWVKEELR